MKRLLSIFLILAIILCGCTYNTEKFEKSDFICVVLDSRDGHLITRLENKLAFVECDNYDDFKAGDTVIVCGILAELDSTMTFKLNGEEVYIDYEISNANVTKTAPYAENEEGAILAAKPVIYLYPEEKTDISVSVNIAGRLTCVYPEYNGVWEVNAKPDGTLTDKRGREYYCLYWEGEFETPFDSTMDTGFVVAGCDTAEFLREKALKLGLTEREANEFIIYWLPQMEDNKYNYVYFATDEYEKKAELNINPAPDTTIRFMMLFKPLDNKIEVSEQILPETPAREGFTLVEWGGSRLKSE